MTLVARVKSVKEFLDRVKTDTRNSTHGSFTIFRGQKDASWKLLPAIARPPFGEVDICIDPADRRDNSKERRLLIAFRDHSPPHLPEWVWTGGRSVRSIETNRRRSALSSSDTALGLDDEPAGRTVLRNRERASLVRMQEQKDLQISGQRWTSRFEHFVFYE